MRRALTVAVSTIAGLLREADPAGTVAVAKIDRVGSVVHSDVVKER
jgi:hypothetical protein